MMNIQVQKSLETVVKSYADQEKLDASSILEALKKAFQAAKPFMEKVDLLDSSFDDEPRFEELREYVFDLLMINFFAEDVQKLEEDYLDSEEWESIEEQTLDRGSELLNILLYINECKETDIEPSLDDFLKEFLLVEEDEFQDEHRIYEKVISNQILVESSFAEIAKVTASIDEEEEIKELFYPILAFFAEPEPDEETITDFISQSPNKSLDLAIYQLIVKFNS